MRKLFAVATSLALAVSMVIPGSAAAVSPQVWGSLDQSAAWVGGDNGGWPLMTQTFTAGKTGLLSRVDVYCIQACQGVLVKVGGREGTWLSYTSGWMSVAMTTAGQQPITAGTVYSMSVECVRPCTALGTANYPGGSALQNGLTPVDYDLAFQTYVIEQPTATYAWDKSSVLAGSATAATLTATFQYPAQAPVAPSVAQPAASLTGLTARIDTLPSWFTPASVTCSSEIDLSDCAVDKLAAGVPVALRPSPTTVTVTITGSANPPAGSTGGGAAGGSGCLLLTDPEPFNFCGSGQALLGIGAPAPTEVVLAATPPVTGTSESGTVPASGAPMLLLLAGSFASMMAVLGMTLMARRSRS
jgi:hypothetical protein